MRNPLRAIALGTLTLVAAAFPAAATNLLSIAPTTAISTTTTPPLQFRDGSPKNLTIQANFTHGTGGTTADAYVQTTVDGGATWTDIAQFHFTTASARFLYNLSSLTAVTTEYTPTDGSLTANTAKDGIIGSQLRVKYATTGTYATTTLTVDVSTTQLTSSP